MLGNTTFIGTIRSRIRKQVLIMVGSEKDSLFHIFDEQHLQPWQVHIFKHDQQHVNQALRSGKPVKITPGLSEAQLLKLHCPTYPDFEYLLYYDSQFDLYEVKKGNQSIALFSYREGNYIPVTNII